MSRDVLYLCKGSGEIGAARQDIVGWCRWCKKLQRAKPGTGKLLPHLTPVKALGRPNFQSPPLKKQ